MLKANRIVYGAYVYLWPSAAGSAPALINAAQVTTVWPTGAGSLTWNSQPSAGSTIYDKTTGPGAITWWNWDVTPLYQQIIDMADSSGFVDHGVRLAGGAKTFCSSNAPVSTSCPSGSHPVLAVTYNDLPAAPAQRSPANGYISPTDSVTLKAQGGANWPDNLDSNGDSVLVNFQISDDGANWTGDAPRLPVPFR